MTTVLVLGSSGQVGGHLTSYLIAKGYDVIEYDIVRSNTEDLRKEPSSEFEAAVKKSDFVFFLAFDAGGSHYLASYQNTYAFIDNNLRILVNTIHTLAKFAKAFLFASSQMSNMNQSTYGILKGIGERYSQSVGGKVVKFWNVYGVEKDKKKFHVISDFISMAQETGVIRMRTNGTETRDFLYADDCCEGLESIMLNYDAFPTESNLHLARYEWTTILEVASIVAKQLKAEIVVGQKVDDVQNGIKNEPDRFLLNWWQPKTSLEEGIGRIIHLLDSSP